MIGLGIDTSFDDTAVAIVRDAREILANVCVSQFDVHSDFGGIVPERASRRHLEMIFPLLDRALADARITRADIDYIAVTHEPGLVGSILIGVTMAKSLALALEKPLVGVNHLKAHVYAGPMHFPDFRTPFLSLLVSGANTLLLDVLGDDDMRVLGKTTDDAVGECLDKAGRTLGLPLPAGPAMERLAEAGDATKLKLPKPMLHSGDFAFSFSGLKTAVLYLMRDHPETRKEDVAAAILESVTTVLVKKTLDLARLTGRDRVLVCGGVAANRQLRAAFAARAKPLGLDVRFPPLSLCTDNAAMIAGLGGALFRGGRRDALDLAVRANTLWRVDPVPTQPPT